MQVTIIAVGNSGYNIAQDLARERVFPQNQLIVCEREATALDHNSANSDEGFLLKERNENGMDILSSTIEDTISKTNDNIIVCSTLGGITGSKFVPLIAAEAIKRKKDVWTLFSMPFAFEDGRIQRATRARLNLIKNSHLVLQQNNDRLKEIERLGMFDMNKPIVETIKAALSTNTLEDLFKRRNTVELQDYIPKNTA